MIVWDIVSCNSVHLLLGLVQRQSITSWWNTPVKKSRIYFYIYLFFGLFSYVYKCQNQCVCLQRACDVCSLLIRSKWTVLLFIFESCFLLLCWNIWWSGQPMCFVLRQYYILYFTSGWMIDRLIDLFCQEVVTFPHTLYIVLHRNVAHPSLFTSCYFECSQTQHVRQKTSFMWTLEITNVRMYMFHFISCRQILLLLLTCYTHVHVHKAQLWCRGARSRTRLLLMV